MKFTRTTTKTRQWKRKEIDLSLFELNRIELFSLDGEKSLSMINRRRISRCWIISWWWRCRSVVVGTVVAREKSIVHHLSDTIDFGDVGTFFGIDDQTFWNKKTKLKSRFMKEEKVKMKWDFGWIEICWQWLIIKCFDFLSE